MPRLLNLRTPFWSSETPPNSAALFLLADVVSEPPAAAGRAGHRGAEISKTRAGERVSCSHTVLVLVFPFLILPLILPQILQNFSGTRDFVERHYFS